MQRGRGRRGECDPHTVVPVMLGWLAPVKDVYHGADRERDLLVVGGTGQRAGELPGFGAHGHPARLPGRRGQGGQGTAQQVRRGRARVIGPVTQVGGQHDLGLGPGGHVRKLAQMFGRTCRRWARARIAEVRRSSCGRPDQRIQTCAA
jgi:hypothetical protein